MKRILTAAGLAVLAAGAHAATETNTQSQTQTITLPGGSGSVTITTSGDATPSVKVVANGKEVEPDEPKARLAPAKGGFMGVGSQAVSADVAEHLGLPSGMYISVGAVQPDSPADKAGLRKNDILTHLDDQLLVNPQQFQQLVRMRKEGDTATVKYLRAGKEMTTKVSLAERELPPPVAAEPPDFGLGGRRAMPNNPFADPFWNGGANFGDMQEQMRRAQEDMMRHLQHGGQVQQAQSSSRSSSMTTDEGKFSFSDKDGDKHFRAEDTNGKVLFDGPVNNDAERAKVPEELRDTLRQMENNEFRHQFNPQRRNRSPNRGQAI
jgi:membrane-associated protease RseP (regulator of RpoE activity)